MKYKDVDEIAKKMERNWKEAMKNKWCQLGQCEKCGYKSPSKSAIQKHHIIPRSEGGNDLPNNIQFLCSNCHAEVTGRSGKSGECEFCGKFGLIEEAHIPPKSWGGETTLQLCPNCHAEWDDFYNFKFIGRKVDKEEILKILEEFLIEKREGFRKCSQELWTKKLREFWKQYGF